jgi:hypothetical protein
VRTVIVRLQAIDGDAGQALQSVGRRLVGKGADVGGRNRINKRSRVFLDFLRRGDGLFHPDHDDLLQRPLI